MVGSEFLDAARLRAGFLVVEEVAALAGSGVAIFDPFSTLISAGVALSTGVTIWPGVTLQIREGGCIIIGSDVQLYPGTRIVSAGGKVVVGPQAEIGEEGGFTIKAEGPVCEISIGQGARLLGGGSMTLNNRVGDGAQVLGPIRMQNCQLGSGGTYNEPDPDKRGAVLKGSGVARQIDVPTGMVIQAFGLFSNSSMLPQSHFHPKPQDLSVQG
ncbi:hypothetical protein EPK99_11525 [Neorhizobium lilium]|uniref:Uncharacterized protein n=2 Tax=Neorhizobium lilium TaxID=2503024 RepID=A0A3S3SG08_9HYPH|nr:hypothetical protein EPK99_11525 [Neorhizobium lilium]